MSCLNWRALEEVPPSKVGWNLRAPCADCPFRRDVPPHDGVATSLPTYADDIESGAFSHSCHKTDPRSDGYQGTHRDGRPIEHCAGALIMILQSGEQPPLALESAVRAGLTTLDAYQPDPRVFGSWLEMAKAYAPTLKRILEEEEQRDRWREEGRCIECGGEWAGDRDVCWPGMGCQAEEASGGR